jgi:hypothetical protein
MGYTQIYHVHFATITLNYGWLYLVNNKNTFFLATAYLIKFLKEKDLIKMEKIARDHFKTGDYSGNYFN